MNLRVLATAILTVILTVMASTAVFAADDHAPITVEWYGHSCFLLTLGNGAKILLDPFDTTRMPYMLPDGPVDVILSTHDHFDHNAVDAVLADYILRASGSDNTFFGRKKGAEFTGEATIMLDLKGQMVSFETVPSYHDDRQGSLRGVNGILLITVDDMVLAHLGDLGHTLTEDQIEAIKPLDVLMIPVGGYYTIDAAGAREIVDQFAPVTVIPMHYKTEVMDAAWPIATLDEFLKDFTFIKREAGSVVVLDKDELPVVSMMVILKYHGQP